MEPKRVCCLYRVSTDKQVTYNEKHEADIPMQRNACHKFADQMGWKIVHEEQEDGVSGHKIRAENRDKIQIIKEMARRKEFDIFLVFMFDRIGRIADETPFVVEWFVKNGIEVWSTQEGQQKFDSHTDHLLCYIRYWMADGESEKTSVRTKNGLAQLVESGHFKGGAAPYGYDLVRTGRINKRNHETSDLKVNEDEAIERCIDDPQNETYCIMLDGRKAGGVILKINNETHHNELEILFVSPEEHTKGIGYGAWLAVEALYPETLVWETCTPYFEKRNIHFYVNKCGFQIDEFWCEHFQSSHPMPDDKEHDPNDGPDEMFHFVKRMK